MPAFVLALDERGRISTWNRQLERVTGYTRAEMLGTEGGALVGSDERPHDLPLKAGGARKVRWSRAEVPDSTGAPLVYAVGIDVTDEQEMLLRTMRAERLAAVGTLAAGLAHEVRNPLNSASLQLAVLERRLERGESGDRAIADHPDHQERDRPARPPRSRLPGLRQADPARSASGRSGRAPLRRGGADRPGGRSGARLREGRGTRRPAPRGRRRRAPPSGVAQPDPQRGRGHAGRGRATLTLRARAGQDQLEVDVEDNGPGFPDELPVFDAFFTTKDQGTGLGLSLVHRIVADHGGSIRVASRPGRTCFTFTLPPSRDS